MNEFANALFKLMLVLLSVLGILLLAIAVILIMNPALLLNILKFALIGFCGIGGISALLVVVISGIKYISLKSTRKAQRNTK